MQFKSEKQIIIDISLDVISHIAPEETSLFKANTQVFIGNIGKRKRINQDESLGFGIGESVTLLTPIVISVTNEIVKSIYSQVGQSVKDKSMNFAKKTCKFFLEIFNKNKKSKNINTAILTLTSEQLVVLRKIAIDKAKNLKLSDSKSELLADAIISSLARGKR